MGEPGHFRAGLCRWADDRGGENELAIAIRERAAELLGVPLTPTTNLATAPVHVRADRDLPYSAVEPILRAAAKAGIPGVRLATERPS